MRRTAGMRGFTLVELLVAMFVAAVMFAMGYGAINQALKDREGLATRQERLFEVQSAMRVMAQDFVQLADRPVREPVGDGWQPALAATGQGPAMVTFTRSGWANPAGLQRPALQRVAYVFDQGKLVREHWPVLDATLAATPIRRELLTKVKSVTLRYMDVAAAWREQWPPQSPVNAPSQDMRLRQRPIAVEVTIELEDWGRVNRIFEVPG
jgi:general secretion pathway protein J